MKFATILALHKKNNKSDKSNYQPMSSLSVFFKKKLEKFSFKQNYNQSLECFLAPSSASERTNLQKIFYLCSKKYNGIENQNSICINFTDYSKEKPIKCLSSWTKLRLFRLTVTREVFILINIGPENQKSAYTF